MYVNLNVNVNINVNVNVNESILVLQKVLLEPLQRVGAEESTCSETKR